MAARPKKANNRQPLTTRIEVALVKQFKFLSVVLDRPLNDLLEEAIGDLLKKYEKRNSKPFGKKEENWAKVTTTFFLTKIPHPISSTCLFPIVLNAFGI